MKTRKLNRRKKEKEHKDRGTLQRKRGRQRRYIGEEKERRRKRGKKRS